MIASLPMYWRDKNADHWQRFWSCVQRASARHGLRLPDLTPPGELCDPWTDHWLRPDLALSMTCGLPFRTVLRDQVSYVGTLGFGLKAPAGHYFSRVLLRNNRAPAGPMRLAYNSVDSQSGWAVSQGAAPFGKPPVFGGYVATGSHAASLAAVAEGRADIAYIDAVTWRLLKRFDPNAGRVHVAGRTAASPALPLIAALGADLTALRASLRDAVMDFDPPHDPQEMGGRLSFTVLDPQKYFDVPIPAPLPS